MYQQPHLGSIISFNGRQKFKIKSVVFGDIERVTGCRLVTLQQTNGKNKGTVKEMRMPKGMHYSEIR